MTSNDLLNATRLTHVRELKAENAQLREELARTRAELDAARSHFALALAAARDADRLPPEGRLLIVVGWNALLGSASILSAEEKLRTPSGKEALLAARVQAWLAAHPPDRAWIVFDGAHAGGRADGRLRISFTGGTGAHRADRLVCDYLRMCRFAGALRTVLVATEDKDFRRDAQALGATVVPVSTLADLWSSLDLQ